MASYLHPARRGRKARVRGRVIGLLSLALSALLAISFAVGAAHRGTATFSNFLLKPLSPGMGDSEPAVTIGPDGRVKSISDLETAD